MTNSPLKIRVLLADDHAVVRAGIRQFLETAGDILVEAEAGDGAEAIRLIEKNPPEVAVLDIQMPKMTGIDVTRWIRTHYPRLGVLILTAYDDEPYALSVLQAGANGYVLKTAAPQEIIQAVREVYAGKSVVDAVIAQKLVARLAHPPAAAVDALSERELEVLVLVAKGQTNKLIATQLNISDRTVQGHLAHIFGKLQAASRTEAVMRAVALGWIAQDIAAADE
ncbi:MAG: response regulator transcription factor [Chloroflexi bacterium]|nr:response regulator transcription factor [Chloroflexota bacterium]